MQPKNISPAKRIYLSDLKILERSIFRDDSAKADQRFFKMQIMDWINKGRERSGKTWAQLLYEMVLARNTSGVNLKYCFYSNKHQKVLLLGGFEAWATKMRSQIEAALNRANGN